MQPTLVKIKINKIDWYVPHYTPSIPKQAILSKQILNKVHTQLQYEERSFFYERSKYSKLVEF